MSILFFKDTGNSTAPALELHQNNRSRHTSKSKPPASETSTSIREPFPSISMAPKRNPTKETVLT